MHRSRRFREPVPEGPTASEVSANFEPYRIVQARGLAGLTRLELAAKMGEPPYRIIQWEMRAAPIVAYQVERLAEALGQPVGFFAMGRPMARLDSGDLFMCGKDRHKSYPDPEAKEVIAMCQDTL